MMPKNNKMLLSGACALLLALSLGACQKDTPTEVPKSEARASSSSSSTKSNAEVASFEPAVCHSCGTVSNIEEIKTKGSGSGIGAVTGAVIGGVIGHQIGGGKGKDVATVAGAGAGAYAGHESEKRYNATTSYRVTISMEDGGTRTVNTGSLNGVGIGSHVRVNGDSLSMM
jgi:uncharacterized protein YcfJ